MFALEGHSRANACACGPCRAGVPRRRNEGGFTLIELLVVIGIIVIMIGALGLALRGGGGNVALQSAQGTLNSLLSAARGQAALKQGSAALLVNSDKTSDGFLRELRVAVQDPTTNNWSYTGGSVFLPSGVYLVPADGSLDGITLASNWPARRFSTLSTAGATVSDAVTLQSGQFLLTNFRFAAGGSFVSAGNDRLIVSAGRRTSATALVFDNPELLRGVALSAYGAPILINDAAGFDN